ncbi:MAG: 2Fe-2S iron-sulfur cluster binding domain-containing protein [Phycisphaerales bacterium]|nr:MAG: 2Fe-2S iron-sulfur cluster binding domain-containing protein [Phycisphaerales bacterium]
MRITFTLNGKSRTLEAGPGEKVRDVLRREGIFSVRNGCDGQGSCGSCAILLDRKLVNSCLLLAPQIDGHEVYTVDSLAKNRELSALQSAFIDAGIVQCGYCTPAMLLAAHELLARVEELSREQVQDALSGIFCRCTGYEQVFKAVELARQRMGDPAFKGAVAPEFRGDLRLIGKAQRKVDGPRLARGERAFVEDMVQPGHCHLKMLRSPHAHA